MESSTLTSDAKRFDLLVRSVTDYAIYLLDLEGRVSSWNSGAERIKGYSADEVLGQDFGRFYTDEDRAAGRPKRALRIARETGRYEDEGWRVRKDGTRFWAMVVVDSIYDDDGQLVGFAKITRDMTERRETQQRLEEAREQLFRVQKMEALGQLTGGLAHDFNNLLTAIIGAAELIDRNAQDPDKVRRLAGSIQGAAQRGGALTRQLLAFARRQALEPKVLDLQKELPATAALLRHSLHAGIELIVELSDQLNSVVADPTQLELALLNLGFNARDAMPDGGQIRLRARNVSLEGEVEGLRGDFVAVSIVDTGHGIPREIRERVLEPFFTTKSFGHGTGLGLSQAYGFASQSQGALSLESEVGTGTTVTLYLPIAREGQSDRPSRTGKSGDDAPLVLVVEDDPSIAALTEDLLDELGYRSLLAQSGHEALTALTTNPDIDILFSDVVMPGGITGLELAKRARQRRPELPILLTTGYSEAVGHASEFPLLSKPYRLEDLAGALRALHVT